MKNFKITFIIVIFLLYIGSVQASVNFNIKMNPNEEDYYKNGDKFSFEGDGMTIEGTFDKGTLELDYYSTLEKGYNCKFDIDSYENGILKDNTIIEKIFTPKYPKTNFNLRDKNADSYKIKLYCTWEIETFNYIEEDTINNNDIKNEFPLVFLIIGIDLLLAVLVVWIIIKNNRKYNKIITMEDIIQNANIFNYKVTDIKKDLSKYGKIKSAKKIIVNEDCSFNVIEVNDYDDLEEPLAKIYKELFAESINTNDFMAIVSIKSQVIDDKIVEIVRRGKLIIYYKLDKENAKIVDKFLKKTGF